MTGWGTGYISSPWHPVTPWIQIDSIHQERALWMCCELRAQHRGFARVMCGWMAASQLLFKRKTSPALRIETSAQCTRAHFSDIVGSVIVVSSCCGPQWAHPHRCLENFSRSLSNAAAFPSPEMWWFQVRGRSSSRKRKIFDKIYNLESRKCSTLKSLPKFAFISVLLPRHSADSQCIMRWLHNVISAPRRQRMGGGAGYMALNHIICYRLLILCLIEEAAGLLLLCICHALI